MTPIAQQAWQRLILSLRLLGLASILLSSACAHRPDVPLIQRVTNGEYGQARAGLIQRLNTDADWRDKQSRSYTLGRMELGLAELANGLPLAAQLSTDEVWSILRTQGLNKDKAVEERVLYEGVRRWKGEPFEQAMMCCYRAIQQGMLGNWDEARGAAGESLFLLKDFGEEMRTEGVKRHERSSRWLAGQLFRDPNAPPPQKIVQVGDSKLVGTCVPTKDFFDQLHAVFDVKLLPDDVVDEQDVYVIQASARYTADAQVFNPFSPDGSPGDTDPNAPGLTMQQRRLRMLAASYRVPPGGEPQSTCIQTRVYCFSKDSGLLVKNIETMVTTSVLPAMYGYGARPMRVEMRHEQVRDYSNLEVNCELDTGRFSSELSTGEEAMWKAYREALAKSGSTPSKPSGELEALEQKLVASCSNFKTIRAAIWQETNTVTRFQNRTSMISHGFDGMIEQRATENGTRSRVEMNVSLRPELSGDKTKSKPDLDKLCAAVKTNFALGYLLRGAAAAICNEQDEARDDLNQVAAISPRLKPLADRLLARDYNTLLIIDYGLGPRKTAYGPDNALVAYMPAGYHGPGRFHVAIKSGNAQGVDSEATMVCDLNRMAEDHRWNNLEDVRIAKSKIGDFFAQTAQRANDAYAQMFYLVIALAVKAGAQADTRQCEIAPSRVYLAPLTITGNNSTLEIRIPGEDQARMVLCALGPPPSTKLVQMLYVRIPPTKTAPPWAVATQVLYANDGYHGRVSGDDLPYILGGRCVCKPSEEVLARYQAAGNLTGMTLAELESLYRSEGIKLTLQEEAGRAGLHTLEGGTSLECPVPGSVGFKRLFCQEHPAYLPKSQQVRDVMARIKGQATVKPVAQAHVPQAGRSVSQ